MHQTILFLKIDVTKIISNMFAIVTIIELEHYLLSGNKEYDRIQAKTLKLVDSGML